MHDQPLLTLEPSDGATREAPRTGATRLRLCGTVVLEIEGRRMDAALGGRQCRVLLAYLALHRTRAIRRDEMIVAVWPDVPPADPGSALRTLLSRLRNALEADVVSGRSAVRLCLPPDAEVDVEIAVDAIARAESAIERSDWSAGMAAAQAALAAVEGGFLPEADGPWVDEQRRRIEDLRLSALECLAACGLGLGGSRLAMTERTARALIDGSRYRETGYRYLMRALAERGRIPEALQVFDEFRVFVRDELGTSPGTELRALHTRLLGRLERIPSSETEAPVAADTTALVLLPAPSTPDPPEPAAPRPSAFPRALSAHNRDAFVGRQGDLERLWRLHEQASQGRPQIVLVRGEPGIGKTRLACELALRAHAAGTIVLYGRCDEEPLLPHQPFVEALGQYVADCPLPELTAQVQRIGRNGGELRRLVPALAERLPGLATPLTGDPEGERYRLFEAAGALLCEAAQGRPLVLVLDDLHWADKPTLLLLRHLVRQPGAGSLLVLGTYRETELESAHPMRETLADLSREPSFERLALGSLDEAAVATLVRSHAGRDAPELVATIIDETEGHPFFVVQLLRHLAESGDVHTPERRRAPHARRETRIPDGVRDVIGRRIARLGPTTHRILTLASVSGRDFELAILERLSDLDEEQLVDALEHAVRARVIEDVAGRVGRYTFSHALIRESIYWDLTATRRSRLHRRVAGALEAMHAEDLDPHRAELAHHFARAGSAVELAKAIDHGARAGDRAVTLLAYEQAAAHYREAASLIESVGRPRHRAQRCDLVIAQGEAERRAGDPAHRVTLLEGARLAQELGDAARLARAALANNRGMWSATTGVDRERVSALRHALGAQPPGDSTSRVRLLAHLAAELAADPGWSQRAELSDEALAMARRLDDPTTLVESLNYRFVTLWGPRTLRERLANCRECNERAGRLDDPVLAFHAASWGAHAAMEAGELELADRLLERAGERAEQLGQPVIRWYLAVDMAKRATITASPDDADRLARAAFEHGRAAGQPDAFAWHLGQLAPIRFLQGTMGGGRPNFLKAAELSRPLERRGQPDGNRSIVLLVEAVAIVTFCEVGRTADARERFDAFMRDGLANLNHDCGALFIPALAAIACAHLGDARRAELLHELLEPHAGQFVDTGASWFGATAHHLALLATVLGRHDEADIRFGEAARAYDALGAAAWLARARLDWARSLLARRSAAASQQAEELLGQAHAVARTLGLAGVERESALLQDRGPDRRAC